MLVVVDRLDNFFPIHNTHTSSSCSLWIRQHFYSFLLLRRPRPLGGCCALSATRASRGRVCQTPEFSPTVVLKVKKKKTTNFFLEKSIFLYTVHIPFFALVISWSLSQWRNARKFFGIEKYGGGCASTNNQSKSGKLFFLLLICRQRRRRRRQS